MPDLRQGLTPTQHRVLDLADGYAKATGYFEEQLREARGLAADATRLNKLSAKRDAAIEAAHRQGEQHGGSRVIDMIGRAAEVLAAYDAGRCHVDWMAARLPADAIRITDKAPPRYEEFLGWVSDIDVSIWFHPAIVRWDASGYWSGLPAKWIDLGARRWVLTHWRPI